MVQASSWTRIYISTLLSKEANTTQDLLNNVRDYLSIFDNDIFIRNNNYLHRQQDRVD